MRYEETYLYHAYLLRLWREETAGSWRASMENPHTGERHNFANLVDLVRFIEEQTGERIDVEGRRKKEEG